MKTSRPRPTSRNTPEPNGDLGAMPDKALSRMEQYQSASDDTKRKYEALRGIGLPVDDLVASNRVAMDMIAASAAKAVRKHVKAGSLELGFQVTRLGIVDGGAAEISVSDVRKLGSIYKRAGVDAIGAPRVCPVLQPDSATPGLAVDFCSLFFGKGAAGKLANAEYRERYRGGPTRSAVEMLDPRKGSSVKLAFLRMLNAPLGSLPPGEAHDEDGVGDVGAFVTLMARSQLRLNKTLVLVGAGKPIMNAITGGLDHTRRKACKEADEVVHIDTLVHFLFAEVRRLGMHDIAVPIVRYR